MVKHIVMFKLRGTEKERRIIAARFVEALMALPEKIECLKDMEAAVKRKPSRAMGRCADSDSPGYGIGCNVCQPSGSCGRSCYHRSL